ncbi:hypothetical protein SADUNF_Sadunf08G0039900 [Salix dunnii]|uniref:Uncharacterized protein n=1 Tax=Salix dunnii TaxID=1413687 RepID=A0A835MS14_9ROSI|nr:hypothetical protein SADUNF_Sadunf08G0039900 [Salix dunnii]
MVKTIFTYFVSFQDFGSADLGDRWSVVLQQHHRMPVTSYDITMLIMLRLLGFRKTVGANIYMAPRPCTAMKAMCRGSWEAIKYAGSDPSASTATGLLQAHKDQQASIVQIIII